MGDYPVPEGPPRRLKIMRNLALVPALLALAAFPALSAPQGAAPDLALVNRISWGADGTLPSGRWLEEQLHPSDDDGLPQAVQDQISVLEISQKSLGQLNAELRDLRQAAQKVKGTPDYAAAQKAYQQKLNDLYHQAQTKSLLRDIYSRNQLKEQLTWFWFNHFNVHAPKGEIRAFVGDYENAIRAHALGKFGDLLATTVIHPAMLQYLDNAQNAAGHINENYAREIMELHTLGVGSGYSQQDVQELARVLTGLGVDLNGKLPGTRRGEFRADFQDDPRDENLTVFYPRRHDFGDKHFLGTTIKGSGINEVAAAIAILVAQPPTAHFVSRQLAQYFCCDAPSERLVTAMAATWKRSNGDIAQVLETLFASDEFKASLGRKFKDPMHYAVSSMRVVYGDRVIVNAQPIVNWLNRMGEPLFGHETPDGYPLTEAAWAGPGQMAARFEIARQIGAGAPQLFRADGDTVTRLPPPLLEQTAWYQSLQLPTTTRNIVTQGATPADRNMLLLSSPEFMRR
ncbi:MAG: hypothetical protein JWP16_1113 [Alphaproteobacteria bacterium]|nr:hypothetical protein [Alphaproteobacteria bacterium]